MNQNLMISVYNSLLIVPINGMMDVTMDGQEMVSLTLQPRIHVLRLNILIEEIKENALIHLMFARRK